MDGGFGAGGGSMKKADLFHLALLIAHCTFEVGDFVIESFLVNSVEGGGVLGKGFWQGWLGGETDVSGIFG